MQHQVQIDELESALEISAMRLKKSQDVNKQLSNRRREWSKREMELQDQINALQSKLEINTMMLKKLDDNELLSKESRESKSDRLSINIIIKNRYVIPYSQKFSRYVIFAIFADN